MKKKWTKTWALLLALTMAGSLIMACQSSKGGSDAAAGDTAKDNAADRGRTLRRMGRTHRQKIPGHRWILTAPYPSR